MSFWISDLVAATTTTMPAGQGDSAVSFLMIGAIFVLFYFMLIRPQNKRAKSHRAILEQLKVGDEVVTAGGLLGKVLCLGEQYIQITIAEGVDIRLQRSAVSTVLPKGTMKAL
jgi:preprotein translocase subunit YajC